MALNGPIPRGFAKFFWSKTKKRKSGCQEWTGYRAPFGYGVIQARKFHSMPMLAHRVAWRLKRGPIPKGAHVLHKCDNPPCVRISHLFLGTQRSNTADRHAKGRTASGDENGARTKRERNPFVRNGGSGLKGEKHPMSKLTDKQVERLQREFKKGINRAALAKKYGISVTHVYRVGKGKRGSG